MERPGLGDPKIVVGNLIAGEKILGDKENEYQRAILEEFDKAIVVDMELLLTSSWRVFGAWHTFFTTSTTS